MNNASPVKASRTAGERRVDMHVHFVGNGSGGSGCWVRVSGWHRPMAALMLKHVGLPADALSQDLESLITQCLLKSVRESSLDAAVILAQDQVYDEQGRVMADKGSFYVPNECVLK